MRTILLAMTEEQHDNRSWKGTVMVGVYLVLTLALNASSREQAALLRQGYLDSTDTVLLVFTAIITAAQLFAATAVMTAESARGELPNKEAVVIILFCHAGNIFLHDYLHSLGSLESSLPTAYFQPLLTIVTLWLVTSVVPRPATWTSTVAIGLGCTFISIKSSTVFNSDRTSLICALAAFAMILRNIVIRQLVGVEHVTVKFRGSRKILVTLAASMFLILLIYLQISPKLQGPILCGLLTSTLSAMLLYVTTVLLKSYSVTFVSLFSVWAILLEAIIITPSGHRPDIIALLVALTFILLGHYIFMKDLVEHNSSPCLIPTYTQKPVNVYEQYTRVEFLMFAALVLGVIFYVFQPKVSQRDLNTLSYVGLDKVIRKLLTVEAVKATTVVEEEGQPHQLP